MENGFIEDFQLKVSTEDALYLKDSGRPGGTGWCYKDEDKSPFFKVIC